MLADYDYMALESTILAYVVGERSAEGVNKAELIRHLLTGLSGDYAATAVERALGRLLEARLLREEEDTIFAGPVFGTGLSSSTRPGFN